MIEAIRLSRSFGSLEVLRDVSFRVGAGEVVGFLGPNGAGKTTTLRILAGFLPPTSGDVRMAGLDPAASGGEGRRSFGYLPERLPVRGDMTVDGFLRYAAALKGVPERSVGAETARVLDRSGAGPVRRTILSRISHGYRRRVGLAQALIGEPPALLLDEPSAGLDPEQAADFRRLIRGLAGKCAVLVSTHLLDDAARICSRVIILDRGEVVGEEVPGGHEAEEVSSTMFHLRVRGDRERLARAVGALPGCRVRSRSEGAGGTVSLEVRTEGGEEAAPAIIRAVLGAGGELLEIRLVLPSLESVYLRRLREGGGEDS